MTTDSDPFKKRLTAFAMIGHEAMKIRDDKLQRIMKLMDNISDTEFDQICSLAEKLDGKEFVNQLNQIREVWKKSKNGGMNNGS